MHGESRGLGLDPNLVGPRHRGIEKRSQLRDPVEFTRFQHQRRFGIQSRLDAVRSAEQGGVWKVGDVQQAGHRPAGDQCNAGPRQGEQPQDGFARLRKRPRLVRVVD